MPLIGTLAAAFNRMAGVDSAIQTTVPGVLNPCRRISKTRPGVYVPGSFLTGFEVTAPVRARTEAVVRRCRAPGWDQPVCTENPIRVYRMIESAKLAR
jgi:hypothetical protein